MPKAPRKRATDAGHEEVPHKELKGGLVFGISPHIYKVHLWEAFFVVSRKWSFPTALLLKAHTYQLRDIKGLLVND